MDEVISETQGRFAKHEDATVIKMLRACERVKTYCFNNELNEGMNVYINELLSELKTRGVVVD